MKMKSFLFLAIGFRMATACSCSPSSVEQSEKSADVIFRGTITDIKDSIVYFQVARAWKGNVGKLFTMPEVRETTGCIGFWPDHLRVGNDLLVYAKLYESTTSKTGVYLTDICTRTRFAEDAGVDFWRLGPEPHFRICVLLSLALFGIGGSLLSRRFPLKFPENPSLNAEDGSGDKDYEPRH